MKNTYILSSIIAILVIGITVLVVVEVMRKPEIQTRTISRTKYVPVIKRYPKPYPVIKPYPVPRPYPVHVVGHRNGPFCEHTKCGCYPGTTTPIKC
jgi:hypothetical protein